MPRNGSGVMSKLAGTTAVANTIIESAKYNSVIDDIIADLNAARPVVAGGTGATTASGARTNLGLPADIVNAGVKGADIASAATTDIGAATGDYVTVTGTTTITALGTITAGVSRVVRFSGALILTHNATSLILPGGANITTAAGDVAIFRSEGSGNWRCINYERATGGVQYGPQLQGQLYGLTLSNNASDATNDIDIAVGSAAADTSPYYLMQLTGALTKRLDAAWAVGTGNGGLDTGSVGNNTYYIWLIQRSDTGVVDALFSTSSTSPTMPTSYDRKRPLGFLTRTAGVNGPITWLTTQALGVGQTWQDVAASRAASTSYQNTTSRPIEVSMRAVVATSRTVDVSSNGTTWLNIGVLEASTAETVSFSVPPNWFYRINGSVTSIAIWLELR